MKHKCVTLVESYWEWKNKVLKEKPIPVPLSTNGQGLNMGLHSEGYKTA